MNSLALLGNPISSLKQYFASWHKTHKYFTHKIPWS